MRIIRSGIYKIICFENTKFYIGSSKDLTSRQNKHFYDLRKNKHCNTHLQNAWNKYGEQAFAFEILEECQPIKEVLLSIEQYYIDTLKPKFNICSKAHSRQGVPNSIEAKAKISAALTGIKRTPEEIEKSAEKRRGLKRSQESIEKRVDKMRGRKHTLEHKEKISTALKGRIISTETKDKISIAQKGKPRNPESIIRMADSKRGIKYTQKRHESMTSSVWNTSKNKKKISEGMKNAFIERLKQTDKVRGVCWNKRDHKWSARFQSNGRVKYLGEFKTKEEAILARIKAQEEYLLFLDYDNK